MPWSSRDQTLLHCWTWRIRKESVFSGTLCIKKLKSRVRLQGCVCLSDRSLSKGWICCCVLGSHVPAIKKKKKQLEQSSRNIPSTFKVSKQMQREKYWYLLWYITEVLDEPVLAATKRLGEVTQIFFFFSRFSLTWLKHKMAQTHR